MKRFFLFVISMIICHFATAEITQDLAVILKAYPKMTANELETKQRKAEMGNTEAQFELGTLYQNTAQYALANSWLEKASNNKMGIATDFLAQNYLFGQGALQDTQKALQLLNKATAQGYLLSNYLLGILYQRGKYVPKNDEIAVSKFLRIADYNLDSAKELKEIFCKDTSKFFDKSRCENWTKKMLKLANETSDDDKLYQNANTGSHLSQFLLGTKYYNGSLKIFPNVQKNLPIAFNWYLKSALQNDDEAQLMLGKMCLQGDGAPKDDKKAFEFITLASKQENEDAQYLLGLMYVTGTGVKKDYQKATYWYKKSADWQNVKAYPALGFAYLVGQGVTRDVEMAKYWFNKGCDNGNQTGCDNYRKLKAQGF